MQRFVRLLRRSDCRVAILIGSLWFGPGCDKRPAPPILDSNAPPIVETPDLEFEVLVEPQERDPQRADVWIRTSHPAVWKSLPGDTTTSEWERLIAVRTEEGAERLPLDRTPDAPVPPGLKGDYAIVDGRLRFRLAEPLRAGAAYRIEFYRSAIPGFDVPGAPPTLPVVLWHVVPEPGEGAASADAAPQ